MSAYATQLKALHDAMVHKQPDAMLPLIKPARHNALPPQERLDIYVDGYDIRLISATLMDYLALKNYMGEDACREAVKAFVHSTPSTYWDLNQYPPSLADFLTQHTSDKAAHALAALEAAIAEIFWLPETRPLAAQQLATLSEEELQETVLYLRTASKLLALSHQAETYLKAYRADEKPESVSEGGCFLLVYRHENTVRRMELEEGAYQLLAAISTGKPFGEAVASVPETLHEQLAAGLSNWLAEWLQAGIFQDKS